MISLLALAGATLIVACGSSGDGGGSSGDFTVVGGGFGNAVAVSGDLIVVGAHAADVGGTDCGAAYVFRFDGTDWVEEQELTASDAETGDWFGRSVAVSGDVIVVGASYQSSFFVRETGSAYVFRFNGTDWVEEQKLTASDAAVREWFGFSIAVSGDVIVVGALNQGSREQDSGAAFVFRFDGTDWVEEQELTASDAETGDSFGRSVAVAGDVIVVGAHAADVDGTNSGAAYVFRFDGTDWVEEQKFTASDTGAGDWFARSLAVAGDMIAVGASRNDVPALDSGSAYVFGFDGTDWVEDAKLTH